MVQRSRKLRVRTEPCCLDMCTILQQSSTAYPNLIHVAMSSDEGSICLYFQNKEYLSVERLRHHVAETLDVPVLDISPYKKVQGELHEEWRSSRFRGSSSTLKTKASATTIFVRPQGKECLQHITKEFVSNILKQLLNFGVFFKFGARLYALDQNVNFRARRKYKHVRVRTPDGWVTLPKIEAYDKILDNLIHQTKRAVALHKEGIPENYIRRFDAYVKTVQDLKQSWNPECRKLYEKTRNRGLDKIAVGVNDRLKRQCAWSGETLKLK